MPQPPQLSQTQIDLLWRANAMSADVRRFSRQESAQGQLSPTDRAFLARLEIFLTQEIPLAVTGQEGFDITEHQ